MTPTKPILTLALLTVLMGCELTEPEGDYVEVWSGIAIPILPAADAAAMADDTEADTTWVYIFHERDPQSNVVHAAITIYDKLPDPCSLWWLADNGEPCYYLTNGSGIQVPFEDPESRVIDFTFPTLGDCELAGPIEEGGVWATLFRCGEAKRSIYRIDFTEEEVVVEVG